MRIPELPGTEILEAVHDFYDQYYFRPKAAYRILRKAIFNNSERKRLYKEARTFLKLRAQRNKWVKDTRKDEAATPAGQSLAVIDVESKDWKSTLVFNDQ